MPRIPFNPHRVSTIWLTSLFVIASCLFVAATSGDLFAATYSHNPYGGIDSCTYANGQTTLYGWAYDADTSSGANPYVDVVAGSATARVPSSITGYRDTPVMNYVNARNPGAPATGGYGWRWTLSGLYQGNSYVVKGTVLNYGAGTANSALVVGHSTTSGMVAGSHPFPSNNAIPDACLTPRPVAAPAPPVAAPAPPSSSSSSSSTKKTTTTTKTTTPAPVTVPAAAAPPTPQPNEITTTVGTNSAIISLPTAGATAVTVKYGPSPQTLTQSVGAADVSGPNASMTLKGLQTKTKYYYAVSRTANNQTSTSGTGEFTTKGFNVVARFVDGNQRPVAGILGRINNTDAVSDDSGNMTFKDMAAGEYTITFGYLGTNYDVKVKTSEVTGAKDGQSLTAEKVVDLSDLSSTAEISPQDSSQKWLLGVALGVAILAVIGFAIWELRRRSSRPKRTANLQGDPLVANTIPSLAKKQKAALASSEPLPAHAGQSLASMVIEAMREEQAAKQNAQSSPVITPSTSTQNQAAGTPPNLPPPLPPTRPK
jgi:hypothetical protein